MLRFLIFMFVTSCCAATSAEQVSTPDGQVKTNFALDGRACFVVAPKVPRPGKPWLWRARFPGYHDEIDRALVADGYHVAFINTDDMFGSRRAMRHWEGFYREMTETYGLNEKVALYGVSRGGLFVYGWAKRHPETVACIYADTPVCDFKSWPGGHGAGVGDAASYQRLLREYSLDEAAALTYDDNPINRLEPIANAQIPIMHIVTEDDRIVPPAENTYVLRKNLAAAGHRVFYVVSLKHGPRAQGHHFDLTHPEIGYHFIKKYTNFSEHDAIFLRVGLRKSLHAFRTKKEARVAFLGGSITQMNGWRNLVQDSLRARFPTTKFDFIDAGISSTDSTMGAFRLPTDVFARGPVDLLFIESAVNELHNGRSKVEMQTAFEGILLAARNHNSDIDIVAQYFFDDRYVDEYRAGRTPWQIAALERVAIQYGVNAIDQCQLVQVLFDNGQMTPQQFGGVHPAPAGHLIYANTIDSLFDLAWSEPVQGLPETHATSWRVTSHPFSQGHFVSLKSAALTRGFSLIEKWRPPQGGDTRAGFVDVPFLSASEPDSEFSLDFEGTAVGLVVVAGPDAGIIEYRIDGGKTRSIDQSTPWSTRLNIPWIYMLASSLPEGHHTLTVRTSQRRNQASSGTACHIRNIAVNGPTN